MINRFYLKAACGTPTGMLAQRGIMGNIGPPRAQPSSLRLERTLNVTFEPCGSSELYGHSKNLQKEMIHYQR